MLHNFKVSNFDLHSYLASKRKKINDYLIDIFNDTSSSERIDKAMKYSLMAGGKRVRPILCIAAAESIDGKSKDVLPLLIDSTKQLDFFIHDSEHTYENMLFELKLAWKKLKVGGIIICDNIDANESFKDFCTSINKKPLLLSAPDNSFNDNIRFGLLIK